MEIERKYLITTSQLTSFVQDTSQFALETRYYLFCEDDNELRFTKRGDDNFTLDRMQLIQDESDEYFVRKKERIVIPEVEFKALIKLVGDQQPMQRLHYKYNDQIELKVYQGRHEGLIRVEVEFASIEDANNYTPDFEFVAEITNTPLGRDVSLAKLEGEQFHNQLQQVTNK
jgi:CYTH domain-containing protein